jgi:hypothetical protein
MGYYHATTERIDSWINGFTAITSSSAVAGWVLWRETFTVWGINVNLTFVWMLLIMLAQVVNALKEHFPYKKRLLSLATLSSDLSSLALVMESDWYKVSRGLLTEDEINDLHMDMKRKKHEATTKSFAEASLPLKKALLARADSDTKSYVETYFRGK